MKKFARNTLLPLALAACTAAALAQNGQNIAGAVLNATTGQPMPHRTVILVQLTGNMQTVATTTTDAAGHYRFSQNGAGPFMVEADYNQVRYFAQVTPGQSETNVSVYDVSHNPSLMQVDAEIMVLQPANGQLAVINEYHVENGTQPPRTLVQTGGMFRFRVPAGATVDMVRVVGPGEMPLAQQPQPTSQHDVYGVNTPLRPGETKIQVSYRIPYPALKAALSETPAIPPAHFEVYVPTPMTFDGAGFTQVGTQDGYKVYGVGDGPVATTVRFNVSGDAPMPSAPADASGSDAASANGAAANGASDASASSAAAAPAPASPAAAIPAPTFLERNLWTVLAMLALGAAAGFGILLAQPRPAPDGAGAPLVEELPHPAALPSPGSTFFPPPPPAAELDQLRDDLFLLEVRRHTRNISEAEYLRLRAEISDRMDRLAGH